MKPAATVASSPARRVGRAMLVVLVSATCLGCVLDEPPYQVVAALADPAGPRSLSVLSGDGALVGREYRPGVEAVAVRAVRPDGAPELVDGVLRQRFRVGPFFARRRLVVTRSFQRSRQEGFRRLPSVAVTPVDRVVTLDFELPPATDATKVLLRADARPVPPPDRSHEMKPITIEPGAVLAGAFGLDPYSAGAASDPVAFRVVAHADDGERVLLDEVLDPADERSFAWSDYRVSLEHLAGREVRIELRTRALPRVGRDAASAVALPVWSVPTVFARRPRRETRNVILISLDTLRADFLGAYGQELATSPNLDRFAAEGALFERAYTTYPSTTASHMTLMTGLYPAVHGVYAPGQALRQGHVLLSTLFAAHGYDTAAVTEDAMLAAGSGFLRGFRTYREYVSPGIGTRGHVAEVVDSAIDWLGTHGAERFFLFLHTYQMHDPYEPPPAYDVFAAQHANGSETSARPAAPAHVRARLGYAGDLLYTDAQIARLLAALDELGRRDDTVMVVTADHGEALGEHGMLGHGWYVIEPVLRIPLLIRAPGRVPAGVRVRSLASLVDVPSTILELAGLPASPVMQGTSLVPLLASPEDARFDDRPAYVEKMRSGGGRDVIVRQHDWKWVSEGPRVVTRYDLAVDPRERSGASDAGALAAGQELVDRYLAANAETLGELGSEEPVRVEVDDPTMQKLRALGYVD
ncbi:MAG: sulfatase [Thermodesulfobacteriota bacterium]